MTLRDRMKRFADLLGRRRHALLFALPAASGGFAPASVELYRERDAFRESIEATGAVVDNVLGSSPVELFRGRGQRHPTPQLARRSDIVQHGMAQIALVDQWREDGVIPDAILGVSGGEFVAPYAAGAISREDCARIVAVIAHAISRNSSPHMLHLLALDADAAIRLCRSAPFRLDFLGTTNFTISMVLSSDSDRDKVRDLCGPALLKKFPVAWRYHTTTIDFDDVWAKEQLLDIASRPAERPIYSAAAGGLLDRNVRFDAQYFRWMVTSPARFARAAAAAFDDGFDAVVQIAPHLRKVTVDLPGTVEAAGRGARLIHAADPSARGELRAMRRRLVVPHAALVPSLPHIDESSWAEVSEAPRDRAVEQLSERLLQPLLEGEPFDVVAALVDPLADTLELNRDELNRLVVTSILMLLRDDRVRERLTDHAERIGVVVDANLRAAGGPSPEVTPATRAAAIATLRTLLHLAPELVAFQPLDTVLLFDGKIQQLMISRCADL